MDFSEFQARAFETDESKRTTVSLFGLAGEVGSIFSAFKKRVRDRRNVGAFRDELMEELGDALWYIASIASLSEIQLNDVAELNIRKARSLFEDKSVPDFDSKLPPNERFPEFMRIRFTLDKKTGRSQMFWEDGELGAPLSDNSDEEDYYRFHDVYHLAFMTFLNWSPVMRALLKRKRKSVPSLDENEDGARAAITEEAISAIVFNFAEDHDFFVEIRSISFGLLKIISRLCRKFEVRDCSARQWQQAIWHGSHVYKELVQNQGGIVEVDREERRITYIGCPVPIRDHGTRLTGSYVIRQKDGPYFTELHLAKLKRSIPNLRVTKIGRSIELSVEVNDDLFSMEKHGHVHEYVCRVVQRYKGYSDEQLKSAVYMTQPMRTLLRREKYGRQNLFNAPIDFYLAISQ